MTLAAPLHAEDLTIDLRYVPTANTDPSRVAISTVKQLRPVRIGTFIDKRQIADTNVGELRINGQTKMLQSTTALAVYTTDVFRKVYGELGGQSANDSQLLLDGEITQFRFEDAAGYHARVGFHFFLQDDSGQVLWDGNTSGVVRGAGKTLTPENISVILSDILRATYAEMLGDEKLVGVWSGRVNTAGSGRLKTAKSLKSQKIVKTEKAEKAVKVEKPEKAVKVEKPEKAVKVVKPEKIVKNENKVVFVSNR
jgi:hypothetical protein